MTSPARRMSRGGRSFGTSITRKMSCSASSTRSARSSPPASRRSLARNLRSRRSRECPDARRGLSGASGGCARRSQGDRNHPGGSRTEREKHGAWEDAIAIRAPEAARALARLAAARTSPRGAVRRRPERVSRDLARRGGTSGPRRSRPRRVRSHRPRRMNVTFQHAGATLSGSVVLPPDGEVRAGLVFLHGSGPPRRRTLVGVGRRVRRAWGGFAVVRQARRGRLGGGLDDAIVR